MPPFLNKTSTNVSNHLIHAHLMYNKVPHFHGLFVADAK